MGYSNEIQETKEDKKHISFYIDDGFIKIRSFIDVNSISHYHAWFVGHTNAVVV